MIQRLTIAVISILLLMSLGSCGASNTEVLTEARSLEVRLMRDLPTGVMPWVDEQGRSAAEGRMDEEGITQAARGRVSGEDPEGRSTDVLSFLIMVSATKKLDQLELKRRKQLESITTARIKLETVTRKLESDLNANDEKDDSEPCSCSPYEASLTELADALEAAGTWITVSVREPGDVGDLRALLDDISYLKDTMDGLSELTTLRLQNAMERRSRFISMLSNLMKKASETQKNMIQNIK